MKIVVVASPIGQAVATMTGTPARISAPGRPPRSSQLPNAPAPDAHAESTASSQFASAPSTIRSPALQSSANWVSSSPW